MGKGAYVQIGNASSEPVTISYSNFSCMYQNGEDGSDFGPISGQIASGASLPATGNAQYIEADASGSCAFQQSDFHMNFEVGGPGGPSMSISFMENNNAWSLNDGSSYTIGTVGGVKCGVTIGQSGGQFYITAMIVNNV